MAFNWQTFRTRALTAIIFAVVMLAGLLWNHWSFFILFSIIHFGCWWEYFRLIEKIHHCRFHSYLKLGMMLMGYGIVIGFCNQAYSIGGYALRENFFLPVTVAGFALMIIGIFQKISIQPKGFAVALLGLIYISLSWGLMIDMRNDAMFFKGNVLYSDLGYYIPCTIIFSIWINDTMAYIVGSLIGKTPFSKISPKKTWEGTAGGALLCVLVIVLLAKALDLDINGAIIIASISAVMGTLGDLLESKLKRMAGVKDSGHLMPGHGGFLDRFDSLLVAVPFVWLFLNS